MFGFLRSARYERTGYELYGVAVAAARAPFFYTVLGVPDTLDGRFDLVGLHAFLLIRRLRAETPHGKRLAQAVFDAMFNDMDVNLREMGVGDLSVGKKVKVMWEAFHGRAKAYDMAIQSGDIAVLAAALARNIWRGGAPPPDAAERLAAIVLAQDRHLAGVAVAALAKGAGSFLDPAGMRAMPVSA